MDGIQMPMVESAVTGVQVSVTLKVSKTSNAVP